MNRFGEIRRLTQIAAPTVGVLTNVYGAHTEGVGDVAGVARAKGEIIAALDREARLVYNADDPWIAGLARSFRGRPWASAWVPGPPCRPTSAAPGDPAARAPVLHYQGQSWTLDLPAAGEHMLYNALAATAVGLALGLPPAETAAALADFQPIARRSQVRHPALRGPPAERLLQRQPRLHGHGPADPGGTRARPGRRRPGGHAGIGRGGGPGTPELGRLAAAGRGGLPGDLRQLPPGGGRGGPGRGLPASRLFPDSRPADGARVLQELLEPGDWLLVKGSRSMHMEGLLICWTAEMDSTGPALDFYRQISTV